MSERRGKKRHKSYYRKSSHEKRQRLNTLAAGMKGFLVTCNSNEKEAVRETYNILNEYAEELYGPEQCVDKTADTVSSDDEDDDMEKAMAKEVKAIKAQLHTERRFQNTDSKAKNCIFIRTTVDDPSELHHKIFSDLYEKKVNKARFAIRMLPVAGTCKASIEDLKQLADDILPKYFSSKMGQDKSYAINFKVRNNNSIGRDSVLSVMADIIRGLNPLNKVNCDHPEISVFVEILCNVCCLGVGTDFYKFRKYNFHEVVKVPSAATTQSETKHKESGMSVDVASEEPDVHDLSKTLDSDVHDKVCAKSDADKEQDKTKVADDGEKNGCSPATATNSGDLRVSTAVIGPDCSSSSPTT